MVACLVMAGCSSEPENLRVWTPADHAHPPETQIDRNRVPQQERPDLTVGEWGVLPRGWPGTALCNTAPPTPTRNPPSAPIASLTLGGASRRASPCGLALPRMS